MDLLNYVWPGLAVWLAWVWVAIGQWMLAKKAMEVMGKNSSLTSFYLTITILGIALVESAVIYWLVVAFQLIGAPDLSLYSSVWAWLAIWLAWMWAWIWEWFVIAWSLDAINRRPEMKWKIMSFMVLFVALVEVVAIYGLIIAFKIIADWGEWLMHVWAWLAVWLAWVWVAIGQWMLAQRAMEVMSKTPELTTFYLTITILGIALVESAVIYWLVVAFQLLGADWLSLYWAMWAWLAIWLAWLGAWIWEGQLIAWALSAMDRNPAIKGKLMTFMVLFVALVEVTAIYGLIIAFKIIDGWVTEPLYAVWAWLAIWLAWVWVAIWRWYMSEKALEVMGKNPKMISFFLTVSILWVALIESAAIYGLIVAFQILSFTGPVAAAVAAWLAIWFTGLGAWLGEWLLIKGAMDSMNADPDSKGKIMAFMVLFVALIEVVAIYWLIIAFQVLAPAKVVAEEVDVVKNQNWKVIEVVDKKIVKEAREIIVEETINEVVNTWSELNK